MEDNFNFDDFDTDSFDDGFDSFDDSFGEKDFSDFGDNGNTGEEQQSSTEFGDTSNQGGDSSGITKTAIISIVVGFIVVLVAFFGMKMIASKGQANVSTTNSATSSNVKDNSNNVNAVANKDVGNKIDMSSSNSSENKNDWKTFEASDEIVFNEDYVDSIFTVVSTKNYVKVVNSENELLVKTVVTGSLSGFTGTYELELPYEKGSQLLPGNNFKVEVQLGSFKEKIVVGEIVY